MEEGRDLEVTVCVVLFRLCGEILEVQYRSSTEEVRDQVTFDVFLSHKFKKPKFPGGIW